MKFNIPFVIAAVGMNIFVFDTVPPEVTTGAIFRGVTRFRMVDMVRLTLLVLFPAISLFLAILAILANLIW